MTAPPTLVVITPIEPSSTGNGLAMRVDALVEAASMDHAVELVVIPVVGRPPVVRTDVAVAGRHHISPSSPRDRHSLMGWLTSDVWRQRLANAAPLPDPVTQVPLVEADRLASRLAPSAPCAVLACRLSTAVFGLRLAESLGRPLIVDVDDDDEDLLRTLGDAVGADAWHRVAELVLPRASMAFAASTQVADALTSRHGLASPIIAVRNPAPQPSMPVVPRPGDQRLLMVANFTYRPNIDGARWLLDQVMPLLDPGWTCDLVGAGSSSLTGRGSPSVRAHEHVDDVSPHYARSDVVVVPLLSGSGTRIKVLEAFTHERPVVATTVGVDGLAVSDGVHALLRDDAAALADAVQRCAEHDHAAPLVAVAAALASETYDRAVITSEAARHIGRTAATSPNTVTRGTNVEPGDTERPS